MDKRPTDWKFWVAFAMATFIMSIVQEVLRPWLDMHLFVAVVGYGTGVLVLTKVFLYIDRLIKPKGP
jgi:hypothetical protein